MKIFQEVIKGCFLAGAVLFLAIIISNVAVFAGSRQGIVGPETVSTTKVVLVLGASVLRSGRPSDVLEDRLLTAVELYQSGKVEKFLLSGDNGQRDYDEVNAMKDYLLSLGIPPEDIFLDHAGFDSYDSVYRAKYIFGLEKMTIVTQAFHLPRAIYIGRSLGMEVQGVPADKQSYAKIWIFRSREWLANVKAMYDVTFKSVPTYLGEPISLEGDGQVTWD